MSTKVMEEQEVAASELPFSYGISLCCAIFIGAVVVANITGAKIVSLLGYPLSVGALAYPVTFLCTDVLADVYGRPAAERAVWMGFIANIFAILFVPIAIAVPPASFWTSQSEYASVLGSSGRIIVASMIAFIVSQIVDVRTFHRVKRRWSSYKSLWIRNNVSTITSQLVDTCIFVIVAFAGVLTNDQLVAMIIGQFLIKALIALLDTPFCYLFVHLANKERQKSQPVRG